MNTQDAKRVLETALICAQAPLPLRELLALFDEQVGADTLRSLLDELVGDWQGRGCELVSLASGWRFQSRPEMREYLDRLNPEKPPRYSRAAMETLAIIAYRQPVTRGDIEDIRGVGVTTQIVKAARRPRLDRDHRLPRDRRPPGAVCDDAPVPRRPGPGQPGPVAHGDERRRRRPGGRRHAGRAALAAGCRRRCRPAASPQPRRSKPSFRLPPPLPPSHPPPPNPRTHEPTRFRFARRQRAADRHGRAAPTPAQAAPQEADGRGREAPARAAQEAGGGRRRCAGVAAGRAAAGRGRRARRQRRPRADADEPAVRPPSRPRPARPRADAPAVAGRRRRAARRRPAQPQPPPRPARRRRGARSGRQRAAPDGVPAVEGDAARCRGRAAHAPAAARGRRGLRQRGVRRLRRRGPPAEGESLPLVPPKRVLAAEPDAPKLQKVLAQAGIGSRRDMEQLVVEGRITVNGEPAHVGQRISFGDQLRIDGKVDQGAHRAAAAARAGLSQAGRRGGHARRPAAPADGVPPPAAAAAGQVAVGRPAGHQHRRAAAVHQLGRTGQPADAPALRRRARVRGARARRGRRGRARTPAAGRRDRRPDLRASRASRTAAAKAPTTGTAWSSPKAATARCASCSRPSAMR